MEIMDGFSRFDKIKDIVYDCKNELDRKECFFDKGFAFNVYEKFLDARRKNSTIADSAMRLSLKKNPLKYPNLYQNNLANLRKIPSIRSAEEYNNKVLKDRCPNTLKARTTLIENDRIPLNEVLPKARGIEKALLKLKLFFK